jgi:hypothetical protein
MNEIRFGIDRGLILEDRGVMLPWNATPEELDRIERPQFATSPGPHGRRLYWRGGRCFGGIEAACISTEFDAPTWPQSQLRGIRIMPAASERMQSLAQRFSLRQAELETRFGPPKSTDVGDWEAEAFWLFDGVSLRHEFWDGFGGDHAIYLFLTTEPKAHDRLQRR